MHLPCGFFPFLPSCLSEWWNLVCHQGLPSSSQSSHRSYTRWGQFKLSFFFLSVFLNFLYLFIFLISPTRNLSVIHDFSGDNRCQANQNQVERNPVKTLKVPALPSKLRGLLGVALSDQLFNSFTFQTFPEIRRILVKSHIIVIVLSKHLINVIFSYLLNIEIPQYI